MLCDGYRILCHEGCAQTPFGDASEMPIFGLLAGDQDRLEERTCLGYLPLAEEGLPHPEGKKRALPPYRLQP